MPIKREAPVFAGFYKFNDHGQTVAGKLGVIKDIGKGDDISLIALFSPAVVTVRDKDGKVSTVQYKAVTINMSGDLRRKLDTGGKDEGKFFSITYHDDEPSSKGSQMKVFNLDELSKSEFKEVWLSATDKSNADKPFPQDKAKETPNSSRSGISGGSTAEGFDENDDDDDLPF